MEKKDKSENCKKRTRKKTKDQQKKKYKNIATKM